ncbi:MAG TPA: caspase family protein [Thermoanaerobaculia bacterium]
MQSAALFVGVREFDGNLTLVPYAADDAVDLAHAFAMREKVNLVPPRRVVLALAGDPQKPESRTRLNELKAAGAQIVEATRDNINALLERQARLAGANGMLIVSFATHGFIEEGVPYVLGKTSSFEAESAISTAAVLDTAALSAARRSLILLDACRERVPSEARAAPDAMKRTAPLIERMSRIDGQVVMYAAAAGKYAYDDHVAMNGVFTKAVLDGLDCRATQKSGAVTVDTLRHYVDKRVRLWLAKNNKPVSGIQAVLDSRTHTMPLAFCLLPAGPANVEIAGRTITVYDDEDQFLWRAELSGRVERADVADLEGNGSREVIVGLNDGIKRIEAFSATGRPLWVLGDPTMQVRTYLVTSLFKKSTSQVIALTQNAAASESRVSVFAAAGRLFPDYVHRGRLEDLLVDRATRYHDAIIIVTAKNAAREARVKAGSALDTVLMLDPKRNGSLSQLWRGIFDRDVRIGRVEIVDSNDDDERELAIRTSNGTVYVDFTGKAISSEGPPFTLLAK